MINGSDCKPDICEFDSHTVLQMPKLEDETAEFDPAWEISIISFGSKCVLVFQLDEK